MKTAITCLLYLVLHSCSTTNKTAGRYSGDVIIDANFEKVKIPVQYDTLQIKYASLLNIDPATIRNLRLYYFIEKWINTPYKWGGMDYHGVDCSAFLQILLAEVYTVQLPRTSLQQFFTNRIEAFSSPKYLAEGDLVFFRTSNHSIISHVGLYLHNKMFINSSSSKGVSIASLDDPYWKSRYVASGRIKRFGKRN